VPVVEQRIGDHRHCRTGHTELRQREKSNAFAINDRFEFWVVTEAKHDVPCRFIESDEYQGAGKPPIHETQVFDIAFALIGCGSLAHLNSHDRIMRSVKQVVAEFHVIRKARFRERGDFWIRRYDQDSMELQRASFTPR
jgi:hypothetical protein